ncbi:MAG: diphthine synthase [Thermoprotei archaeon]|nr:MAG: diphthine synthase [Thermoprotei archaeon]
MLIFVGLGLHDLQDLTFHGFSVLKKAKKIYMETYTNIMPDFSRERLETLIGEEIVEVSREFLESDKISQIIEEASKEDVVLLVPGDPFIATTHITVRIEAEKRGVKTMVVHAPSIISSAISECGLQIYKFGKIATIVYPEPELGFFPFSVYEVLKENLSRRLHTFFLLDLKVETGKLMTISDAIDVLFMMEEKLNEGVVTSDTLGVGLARVGSPNTILKAGSLAELKSYNFGPPPHSLIIPSILHPIEAEALIFLCNANKRLIEKWTRKIG